MEVENLFQQGIEAAQIGQIDQAAYFFHQAESACRQNKDMRRLATAFIHLAMRVFFIRGEFSTCITHLNEAIFLTENDGETNWLARHFLTILYFLTNDLPNYTQQVKFLNENLQDTSPVSANHLLFLATTGIDRGELPAAEEFLNQSLRAAYQFSNPEVIYMIQLEFSRLYRQLNRPQEALSWAYDIFRYGNLPHFLQGVAQIELALVKRQLKDMNGAQAEMQRAIQTLTVTDARYELARAFLFQALWDFTDQSPDATESWLRAAQAIQRGGFGNLLQREQDLGAFVLLGFYLRSENEEAALAADELAHILEGVPAPPLQIITLGRFALAKKHVVIPDKAWTRRKAAELLRFLLIQNGHTAMRDVIIEALWPDKMPANADDSLHQLTSTIRRVLEPDLPDRFPSRYLKVEEESITLTLPPGSVVDYEAFDTTFYKARKYKKINRLEAARQLYTGDLFPADLYRDWSAEKRAALQQEYKICLLLIADVYLAEKQYALAIDAIETLLPLDPLDQEAVLIAMQAYAASDKVIHAVRMYRKLEQQLWAEFKEKPEEELRALARQLSQDRSSL